MKIRAAVLQAIGAERTYDASQPLAIEELELDPPGTARCWCGSGRRGCATRISR